MNQIINDQRTSEQKQIDQFFVMGKDTFMSGWGQAKDKVSYAVWVFMSEENMPKFLEWIKSRDDMEHIVYGTTAHLETLINVMALSSDMSPHYISIYQTTPFHPAITNE